MVLLTCLILHVRLQDLTYWTRQLPSDADVTMFEGKCFELKFSIIPQDKDDRKYYKSLGFEYDYSYDLKRL